MFDLTFLKQNEIVKECNYTFLPLFLSAKQLFSRNQKLVENAKAKMCCPSAFFTIFVSKKVVRNLVSPWRMYKNCPWKLIVFVHIWYWRSQSNLTKQTNGQLGQRKLFHRFMMKVQFIVSLYRKFSAKILLIRGPSDF